MARQSLANTLATLGDLPAARKLQSRVVEAYESALPADDPKLARARNNMAATLVELGELPAARTLMERVLEVSERTLPADDTDLAAARGNLAGVLLVLGDLQAARTLDARALATLERTLPADNHRVTSARESLAAVLFNLGDVPAARALQERVLEVLLEQRLPADDPDLARARGNLSAMLFAQGDLPAARALQERVLEVCERTLPADHPNLAAVRLNLASTLSRLGEFSAARALQERVLEVEERTLPSDHPDLADVRLNLGVTLRKLGDLPAARALQERALEVCEHSLSADPSDLAAAREGLARTLGELLRARAEATPEEAGVLATLAIDLARGVSRIARSALLDASPREAEERMASQSEFLASAFSLARGYGIVDLGPEVVRETFLLGESNRGGALLAARLAARAGNDEVARELRRKIAGASDDLARLAHAGASAEELGRARATVDEAGRELARHASALLGNAAAVEPTLEALTQGLAASDAMVAWRRTTLVKLERGHPPRSSDVDSLVAFVLRPGARAAGMEAPRLELVDLGPIAPIEAAARAWREGLGVLSNSRGVAVTPRDESTSSIRAQGAVLREKYFDPLLPALAGARRIVVALDDVLHLVPLDALPIDESSLVGDRWQIETRTTLTELLQTPDPLKETGQLVAFGDVDYGADKRLAEGGAMIEPAETRAAQDAGILRGSAWSEGFSALPGTGVEVRGIARCFADQFGADAASQVCEHASATRERLLALASKAHWLHIATHGWFAPESIKSWSDPEPLDRQSGLGARLTGEDQVKGMSPMLLCGLALAGANSPENSVGRVPGLVTAEELSTLDLTNCELVVLSACDTNVGINRAGQGVASLQKALQMAGARSVITSLWKVPDEATKELMLDFYRRMWVEKKPKWQALWEAKKKLREAKDERGAPKYTTRDWAAWVLTGATD